MKKNIKSILFIFALTILFSCSKIQKEDNVNNEADNSADRVIYLDTLDLSKEYHALYKGAAAGKCVNGKPLTLNGKVYEHGFGVQVRSEISIKLYGEAEEFTAEIGVDDEGAPRGVAVFEIYVDGVSKYTSKLMKPKEPSEKVTVNLRNAKRITLIASQPANLSSGCFADWADAKFTMKSGYNQKPETYTVQNIPADSAAPIDKSPAPKIHGPKIAGVSPGKPFLYKIPVTGNEPLSYNVKSLPLGLKLNTETGIISGIIKEAGDYPVVFSASNSSGNTEREFLIRCGENKLAQTPPMGWNSWNSFALDIDDKKVRDTADNMVAQKLASYGYQYVVIDDAWAGERDQDGNIRPVPEKFPDMKALADYVHSKGLKIGIYSSPGPSTCANYPGSYQHETQDAQTFAEWGMDYLKYDWCHYSKVIPNWSLPEQKKPYALMGDALKKTSRDIMYSYCQYGMGNVWEWGRETGGNLWRTTGDLIDNWGWLSDNVSRQRNKSEFSGPGGWNDPDMLVLGTVRCTKPAHPCFLTQNEQIFHMSFWAMYAAPLMIGCDLSQIDDFTFSLLCNDEIIDLDQDVLGTPGEILRTDGLTEVWTRPLSDGSTAVGFFNRDVEDREISVNWNELKIEGKMNVRDLWLKKDIGKIKGTLKTTVPAHGAKVYKISR